MSIGFSICISFFHTGDSADEVHRNLVLVSKYLFGSSLHTIYVRKDFEFFEKTVMVANSNPWTLLKYIGGRFLHDILLVEN